MKRKTQSNSVFARILRSKLYVKVWFLLTYLSLLIAGSMLFFAMGTLFDMGTLCEGRKIWLSFLIVGLIILASSLLSKMYQDWLREKANRDKDKVNNGV
jgi:hypothetical protein